MTTHQPDRPASRRVRNPRGTRERLVRAALDLFTTRGFHASTTPLIAARAGVAEGTIYRHFTSKDHLLNEIHRAAVRLFAKVVTDADPRRSCQARLDAIALGWRDLAARDSALVPLVFSARFGTLLDDKGRLAEAALREDVERLIAAGKAAGEVRAGAVKMWADVWIRLTTLMLERVASGAWRSDDVGVRHVIDAAWDAIRAPGAPGQPTSA